jgi:hypothetical protein
MRVRIFAAYAILLLLTGCPNHPVDCGLAIYHADCLPGTAGYADPNRFAATDDVQCKSYGLAFGTPAYAECREKLSAQHQSAEPVFGGMVVVPVR